MSPSDFWSRTVEANEIEPSRLPEHTERLFTSALNMLPVTILAFAQFNMLSLIVYDGHFASSILRTLLLLEPRFQGLSHYLGEISSPVSVVPKSLFKLDRNGCDDLYDFAHG